MHPTKRKTVLATLALAGAWPLAAQQATPAPAASEPTAATEEEIVVLSPFEVTGTADTGYVATDTLAGTRIRSELRDIGSAISVVTKDLMNDIGATDSGSLLQYTTNTEVAGTRGTFSGLNGGTDETSVLRSPGGAQRVRGLAAADTTRDYFVSDIPWDSYNVDRIDILRGPNSFLFGLGSPAGIQNASLQGAGYKTQGRLEHRTGSYGSQRALVNYNHVLIDDVLSIRVAGLWDHENFRQKPAFEDDERVYGALRWDPKLFKNPAFKTSFKVKYEAGDIDANRPRNVTPFDSITPWFRDLKADGLTGSNPFGGAGRLVVTDPYAVERTDANIVAGDGWGLVRPGTPNYTPWIVSTYNAQQPFWTIDGATGQLYNVQGGWINAGALSSAGTQQGASVGVPNKRFSGNLYSIAGLNRRANTAGATLPNAQYGGYRDQSLTDPTIFDFYNNLIDGPNKSEWQRWTAYNIDFTQTGWDDRVGVNLTYDRQKSKTGNQSLLGWNPTLNIDLTQNFEQYFADPAGASNPNFGRVFVKGAEGAGGGSVFSDREYQRASLYGELRVADLTDNKFLVKLLGKHRLNGVASKEKYFNENRNWQLYANSQEWAAYWNGNSGATSTINDRAPGAVIYLGPQITSRTTASGAYIPRIMTEIDLVDSGILVFDPKPKAGVDTSTFKDPWTVPANLENIIGVNPAPTQASNLSNLVGWNRNFVSKLMRYNDGEDERLLTKAQKSLKKTSSYSGSYQGFFWNNALVTTLGWRYDTVKTKDITAQNQPGNRNILNLSDAVVGGAKAYVLPDEFPENQIVKGHSFNWQGVLHLNRLLEKDPLPINVSLSYAKSDNFQVTSIRRDLYGNPLDNPSGETKEYGVLLATKDGKFSFRANKFETSVKNTSSSLENAGNLGSVISNGLNWRNVFLYEISGAYNYDSTINTTSYRNRWTNAYPSFIQYKDATGATKTYADGTPEFLAGVEASKARMNEAIRGWNEIQTWLAGKGFFSAWNFGAGPTGPAAALVDRATYLTDIAKYAPNTLSVYSYQPVAPQGFTVTADTISKGYEFEFTANPLPNWRVAFNASKTEATRNNVGGAALSEFIAYLDSKLYDSKSATGFTAAGEVPRWGGSANAIAPSVYAPWRSNYVKMKLQEGTQADEVRQWAFNVMTNYSFRSGRLKGAGIGGAYRWQDKSVVGYPVTSTGGYDLTNPYYGPSEDAVDVWLSYERKLTEQINWKIQLNVRNLFAEKDLIPTSVQPDGVTWGTVRVTPSREWFVTNTFSF